MPNRTHWNCYSNSGSSTVGPNEPATRLQTRHMNPLTLRLISNCRRNPLYVTESATFLQSCLLQFQMATSLKIATSFFLQFSNNACYQYSCLWADQYQVVQKVKLDLRSLSFACLKHWRQKKIMPLQFCR